MIELHGDFETRSRCDLKKHGVYRYMADPSTDPLMFSYTFNGPRKRWLPHEPCPPEIAQHIRDGGMIVAHNAGFERLMMQMILAVRYGWPYPRTEQFRCTAAKAAALSLPRDLKRLGDALDLNVKKDTDGAALIRFFCMPRKDGLFNEPADHPEKFARFQAYCDDDVGSEAEADRRMMPLSPAEQDIYTLDQVINDRGIAFDRESALAALELAEKAKAAIDREVAELTGGWVRKVSEVSKLHTWLVAQDIPTDTVSKADLEVLLELDDLPGNVRRVLELRQEGGKTSVSKLQTMLNRCSDDGRIRGAFLYHGAGTGRWSSPGANLQNMPRYRKVFEDAHLDMPMLFDVIRTREPDMFDAMYGQPLGRPLHLISDAIRGFLTAAPGKELLAADYSGIEGAVAAWLAGENWKLKAMHELIADPSLPDLYRRAAAGIYNTTTDAIPKKDQRRQVGKVSELSLQYAGGVGAFRSMARGYGLKIEPVFAPVWEAADEERRERAVKRYEKEVKRKSLLTQTLSREAWLAAELVKLGWRATHPAIVQTWEDLEDAIRSAVENPGQQFEAGKTKFLVARNFLWALVPAGGCLAYGNPRIRSQVWAKRLIDGEWTDSEIMSKAEAEALALKGEAKIERAARAAVTAMGVDAVTKQWTRFALYGGLSFENLTQRTARDLFVEGMRNAEAAGYPVVHHVYDELVTEVPIGWGDVDEFCELICRLPAWASGMPLAADGWRGPRYKKG